MNPLAWLRRLGGRPERSGKSEPIIVVSGLPRSGTSLMMQMLEAAGIPVATDGVRTADVDNPRGYYELERVKRLDQDAGWLGECRGKAVKIISMLLPELPAEHEYRVIFLERRLSEILASQKKMQERRGTLDPGESDDRLAASYERHLASVKRMLAAQSNSQTLYISYDKILGSPRAAAAQIGEFLHRDLDREAMVRAIDTGLHRQRALQMP